MLPSTDVSEEIISKAKMLRKSESVYTSQHVYINRYLTKSEAEVAYEMRQQRRARELNRNNKGPEVNKSTMSTNKDTAMEPCSMVEGNLKINTETSRADDLLSSHQGDANISIQPDTAG